MLDQTIPTITGASTPYDLHATRICLLIERSGIPGNIHDGLTEYVLRGRPCGGFLMALMCNDFLGACGRADDHNLRALHLYARLLTALPCGCSGTPQAVQEWIKTGGLRGFYAASAE